MRGLNDSIRREVRSHGSGDADRARLRADGDEPVDAQPSGPEIVAEAIVAAVDRPRRTRIVPANYRIAVFLDTVAFPRSPISCSATRIQRRFIRDARAERAAANRG